MTVIVATKTAMYSDSSCTVGDSYYPCYKIVRYKGELLGVAGKNRSIEKFIRWYQGTRKQMMDFNELEDGGDSFSVIILNKKGIFYYEDCSLRDEVLRDFHGCGTGWPAAHAALLCGKSPREAIELACKTTSGCGLPVQEFTL
jgi:hypothetical protein